MSRARSFLNAGHAVGWTALMCTVGVSVYTVTRSAPAFQSVNRLWVSGLAKGLGLQVRTFGMERLSPDETYVFIANHLSHLDIVALFHALPMSVGFLSKQELRRVPLLGAAMAAGGHVFVDRKRHEDAMRAMAAAAQDVREGRSLVVFPEGTRGTREVIQSFKRGAFHLAAQAGVPLVPVGLRGTHGLMARSDYLPRSGTVEVHVGEPVSPADYPDVPSLANVVRGQVAELAGMPLEEQVPEG